tara:strand:+ start:6730 stop:7368 length:639 start_codon:yes stop_codon:yes gene_type:complete
MYYNLSYRTTFSLNNNKIEISDHVILEVTMKKVFKLLTPWAVVLPLFADAQEQSSVNADVSLSNTLSISVAGNLNFGLLEFESSDAGGQVTLKVNGNVQVGNTGYASQGSPSAGVLNVAAPSGESITVSCSNNAVLTHENSNQQLNLNDTTYKVRGVVKACAHGPKQYTSTGFEQIRIGAKLNLLTGSAAVPGLYATSNTGGTPLSFTLTYQ